MAMGKVYLLRNAPWVVDLVREMLTFPAGAVDDQVDVLGLFGRMLGDMTAAVKPKPERPRWHDGWDDDDEQAVSWKAA